MLSDLSALSVTLVPVVSANNHVMSEVTHITFLFHYDAWFGF